MRQTELGLGIEVIARNHLAGQHQLRIHDIRVRVKVDDAVGGVRLQLQGANLFPAHHHVVDRHIAAYQRILCSPGCVHVKCEFTLRMQLHRLHLLQISQHKARSRSRSPEKNCSRCRRHRSPTIWPPAARKVNCEIATSLPANCNCGVQALVRLTIDCSARHRKLTTARQIAKFPARVGLKRDRSRNGEVLSGDAQKVRKYSRWLSERSP